MVELGRKYECPDCEVKFYDLGRAQALCPKCGRDLKTDDEEEKKPPAPRSAPRTEPAKPSRDDEAVDLDGDSDAEAEDDLADIADIDDEDDAEDAADADDADDADDVDEDDDDEDDFDDED